MALNSGDMLYYEGSKRVNSSTLVSSLTLEVIDNNTRLAYPVQSRHKLTAGQGLTRALGMGPGSQLWNEDSSGNGNQISEIDRVESAGSPTSSSWLPARAGDWAVPLRALPFLTTAGQCTSRPTANATRSSSSRASLGRGPAPV